MKKRILFAALAVLIVIAALAGVKTMQIRTMIDHGKKAVLPPDTVTTVTAKAQSWETSLSAVGSLAAVQGVTVAAELPAKVVEIAFEPGARIQRGDLLIRQDTSVEEAQLPGAEAQVTLTKSVLARDVEMLKDKIISQADYDAHVAGHRQALSQVETLRATISKKTIRAPFGGRLGLRQVNLGQTLREGDPIVTLQSLDPIYVNFALPQQEMSRLRTGMPVRITSDAFPGKTIAGRITTVSPLVDVETRTVQIQATVANPDEKLTPGMFVNAAVGLPLRKPVVAIPATAVLYAPFGDSVFVVDEKAGKGGKTLRQQFVRLGERRGDFIAITEGLADGATIVGTGVFKLRNGQSVLIDNRLAPSYRLAPAPKND